MSNVYIFKLIAKKTSKYFKIGIQIVKELHFYVISLTA